MTIRHVAGVGVVLAALAGCYAALARGADTSGVHFTRLLKVGTDVVFSYARISADGRFLVYASQPADATPDLETLVLRVVDLELGNTIFIDRGLDGYWSPDGTVLVYLARHAGAWHAATWNRVSGARQLDILPFELGDYYSIGGVAGANVLLTINGWYVGLRGDQVTSAPARMPACPVLGIGDRPLVSRDGTRASVFVGDRVILRNLRDCAWLLDTGVIGGKADWSARGTHIATHSPKPFVPGYEIAVFDVASGAVRRLSGLQGDSYSPSWTDDNAVVFRYEGPEYNGFVRADGVLAVEAVTRPVVSRFADPHTITRDWARRLPPGRAIVLIWATWGAHSAEALAELAAVGDTCRRLGCSLVAAHDPTSAPTDVTRLTRGLPAAVQIIEAPWSGMESAGGFNQTPTYLLFDGGCLVSRELGAKSRQQLESWIARHLAGVSRESMPTVAQCVGAHAP